MPYQTSTNHYQNTKFIVTAVGDGPYNTVQAALDAANTEAIATSLNQQVFIRSGVYTEDLTLYAAISIWGEQDGSTAIVGTHTPPAIGDVSFYQCQLRDATDILNSAAAGTGTMRFDHCIFNCTNGHIFNMTNWLGAMELRYCIDVSTANGIAISTAGADVRIYDSIVGVGANVLTITGGTLSIYSSEIGCPITTAGACTVVADLGTVFDNTVTIGGTSTAQIYNCSFETGANAALIQSSANPITLSEVTVDSTNAPPIGGAGAGNLVLGSITFIQENGIAGTVTKVYGTQLETGSLKIDDADQGALRVNTGAITSIQGQNILYVGKHGNDANDGLVWENAFLTINAAVTAAAAGDTIQVDPGTYTETVTHAVNNVTVIGRGKPNTCIITQADANVVNFVTFTGIEYQNFTIQCTAATTAINTVQGTTGTCTFWNCYLRMVTAADIVAVNQPRVGYISGAGTIRVRVGGIDYFHTGNGGGTALKGAFGLGDGGLIDISRCRDITITNSGTALATSLGIDLSTTGVFYLHDNVMTVTDPNATNVVGFAYLGGTGLTHEFYRNTIHVVATNNIGHGFFSGDTATTSRFFYNHIHVTDAAGTSYAYTVGNGATVIAHFDDLIADNGINIIAGGAFYEASSQVDGDFTCQALKPAATEQITIANTDNTATAGNAALNLSVGGTTSTGDPYVNWLVSGGGTFSAGIDNSDADNWKLTTGATPSAGTECMEIDSTGNLKIPAAFACGTAAIDATRLVRAQSAASGVDLTISLYNSSNTANSNSRLSLDVGGTSGGDPYVTLYISGGGTPSLSIGRDNSAADEIKITTGATPSAGTTLWQMTTAGERTMPLQPAFLATQTAAQNDLPINATTTLTINNEVFDQNADYNAGTYTFTAPVTGKYQLQAHAFLTDVDAASTYYRILIITSNATFLYYRYGTDLAIDSPVSFPVSVLCDMDAADTAYIAIGIPNSGAAQADVQIDSGAFRQTYFSGALIC